MAGRTLLVEGTDDQHVIYALLKHHQVPEVFKVADPLMGVTKLLDSIDVRLRTESNLERLAVVLDADENLAARWDQLRHRVRVDGESVLPETPDPAGTVVELDRGRKFGVWLMPDNRVPGLLESFVSFLVPEDDALMPLVDGFLTGLPDPPPFPEPRRPKARIHAWLAVQKMPGKPLGQAITAKYLKAESPVVSPFISWVRRALVD